MNNNQNEITVKMFSTFSMEYKGKVISDETIRSDMVLKLLVFILNNRTKVLHAGDICETLWQEDEIENPVGALKNLMYRLRATMNKSFGKVEFIKTLRGSYIWNEAYTVILDTEEFERIYHEGKAKKSKQEQRLAFEEALKIYTGELLPKYISEHWILQQMTYYHSLFISCVKELALLYEEQEEYEKLELLCTYALKHEELDETIHCQLMKAMMKQGKKAMAQEHYKITCDLLYSQLGTRPSKETQDLYQELLKEIKDQQMDLGIIQQDLIETKNKSGAYFCEYGVFREIYTLQSRQAKRLGIAVHCGLITIEPQTSAITLHQEAYQRFKETTLNNLKTVILTTLRSGDVVARYSATQFVILLPTCDYEGGLRALERIEENFYHIATRYHAKLTCELKEMVLD